MTRTLSGLAAADAEALDALKKLTLGSSVTVEIKRPRNTGQHRLYWALCTLVADHHQELSTAEQVHETIKLLTGHCDVVALRSTGEVVRVPRSISFNRMSNEEFVAFFRKAKDVVCEHLLPGVHLKEVEDEVLRMVS
jgi:hypothetical protein